jgi:excisionase family DNA binding protein
MWAEQGSNLRQAPCKGGPPTTAGLGVSSDSFGAVGESRREVLGPVGANWGDSSLVSGTLPARGPRLRVVDGGATRLLTVRQVASKLGVSTATVYKLAERGELPHLRVSNAIRVAPDDLARFIGERRRSGPTGGRGGRS